MVDWVVAPAGARQAGIHAGLTAQRSAEANQVARGHVTTLGVPRVPAQVVVLVGLTAGGYAATLAGVTALQSSAEAATAASRAPVVGVIQETSARNDALAARLSDAVARQGQAADAYQALLDRIAATESALAGLTSSVAAVDGASHTLPTRVALPTTVRTVIRASSAGSAHATTGGSAAP